MLEGISLDVLSHGECLLMYSNMNPDYLNMEAIFTDETENFVKKINKGKKELYELKFRTAKDNVDEVTLKFNDKSLNLSKTQSDEIFDYYTIIVDFEGRNTKYYYTIEKKGRIYCFNKRGLFPERDPAYDFTMIPKFNVPEWAKGSIIYQIFVDRFYNGDKTNDVVNNEYAYLGKAAKCIDNWNMDLTTEDICNFYGGDLKGIMDKIPYLKDLGVDVIFLNPIFVSPSNHKYDAQDYDYIDPHYGVIAEDGGEPLYFGKFHNKYATKYIKRTTDKKNLEASNKLFADLIKLAHKNGIKVILDGVFNHCGAFNKWLDREGFYQNQSYPAGAYREKNSKYHNYFKWYTEDWPNNDCYDSWWGHDNHPKLNFENSKELYDYFMNIGKKWVSPPFNADGWRLDVAADLGYSQEFNHKFWQDFRKAVKKANPEAVILAEHYGDVESWLQGNEWDTVMNYDAFMEPITWFLTGMEKHSEEFRGDMLCNAMAFEGAMRYNMARFSVDSLYSAMNELSNHDHSRFLTRTNMRAGRLHTNGKETADSGTNRGIMYEAVMFQMTWPGAPTIYYGDEAGVTGWTDPDNRRTYPWGNEDMQMLSFHKDIIKLRKSIPCLKKGSVEYVYLDYGIISYARWDSKERVVVILNNNNVDKDLNISVWKVHIKPNSKMTVLMETDVNGYCMDKRDVSVVNGKLKISLKPYSSILLVEKN